MIFHSSNVVYLRIEIDFHDFVLWRCTVCLLYYSMRWHQAQRHWCFVAAIVNCRAGSFRKKFTLAYSGSFYLQDRWVRRTVNPPLNQEDISRTGYFYLVEKFIFSYAERKKSSYSDSYGFSLWISENPTKNRVYNIFYLPFIKADFYTSWYRTFS